MLYHVTLYHSTLYYIKAGHGHGAVELQQLPQAALPRLGHHGGVVPLHPPQLFNM